MRYSKKEPWLAPRLAWQAACEAADTAGELALQLRALDTQLQWDAARPPAGNDSLAAQTQVRGKRPARPGHGWEYLVKVPALPQSMVTTPPPAIPHPCILCSWFP